jgi:SNF2 family DNA or RNA helicase
VLSLLATNTTGYATLVVVPASLVSNWIAEIKKHTRGCKIRVLAKKKEAKVEKFTTADIHLYLISFNILSGTLESNSDCQLFRYKFHRCIVDEAHLCCNPKALRYRAIRAVHSQFHWAITGIIHFRLHSHISFKFV